ncbi:MAG: peptidoglycan DD-metalloendopeptidase family protein [Anaerolineales bacterium]|nr:peptidoglycan DD-metalloendopeptidase family protein [Anaerolineales bacterium]MCB9128379.1 peptidoglycan DD-metalloendopeptidase family protein [Ardenticatenales bacterium]
MDGTAQGPSFDLKLEPHSLRGPTPGRFNIRARNLGDRTLTISLSARAEHGVASYRVQPASLTLQPGEEGQAILLVVPQMVKELFTFAVEAVAQGTGLVPQFEFGRFEALAANAEHDPHGVAEPTVYDTADTDTLEREPVAPLPVRRTARGHRNGGGGRASVAIPESPRIRGALGVISLLLLLLLCLVARLLLGGADAKTVNAFDCPSPPAPPVTVVPIRVAGSTLDSLSGGFLELPFPYDGGNVNYGGTTAQFRTASNRTAYGGRINSYFDHEYPLYPVVWNGLSFGGSEPSEPPGGNSLLLFDGSRSTQDWYTGHPGYDFSPLPQFYDEIPIFAAADGVVHRVGSWPDGNHWVEIRHDVSDAGSYLTQYLHLQVDEHWSAMQGREGLPIRGGERIGTMGTTGMSTGNHLHFEVRHDANRDGNFSSNERVDPYGMMPGVVDPWQMESRYLWRHPLGTTVTLEEGTEQIIDDPEPEDGGAGGGLAGCPPAGTFAPGTLATVAWAPDAEPTGTLSGAGFGCYVGATAPDGTPIERFDPPLPLSIRYDPDSLAHLSPDSLAIHLYDVATDRWQPLETNFDEERLIASASMPRPGKCALMGEPAGDVDFLAPQSRILLDGTVTSGGGFEDDVTVRIEAEDVGGSGVAEIRYSTDLGQRWQPYESPFTIKYGTQTTQPAGRGSRPSEGPQGESLGLIEGYVVMAQAIDNAGNEEQPIEVVAIRFATPAATPFPTASATAKPTSSPTPCSLDAEFVADVSVPDGSAFAANSPFEKTWRIRNSGSCAWDEAIGFAYVGGDPFGAPPAVGLKEAVKPGGMVDLSVRFTAPSGAGSYESRWQLQDEAGNGFGDTVFVRIAVSPTPTPEPTVTPTPTWRAEATFTPTITPSPTLTPTITPSPTITAPDLIVSILEPTGSPMIEDVDDDGDDDFLLPFRMIVQNRGDAPASLFRIELSVCDQAEFGSCSARTFFVRPVYYQDGRFEWYPSSTGALAAGASIQFEGLLLLGGVYGTGPFEVQGMADSCGSDEFPPEGCSVPESNENNNWSRIIGVEGPEPLQ